MPSKSDKTQEFYRWVDAEGRLHVVSSLDAVPIAERARAERVSLNGATAVGSVPSSSAISNWRPDAGSFALGFGVALLLTLLFRFLPNSGRILTRVVVVLGVAAVLTGLYLGSIRRSAGLSGSDALASPSALIDDAKAAVEKLQTRQKQQDEELRKIQTEGR